MSHNLLVTKLFIPPARKNLVPDPRLIQILNDAWHHGKKLILVSASASYAKTTLITEWLQGLLTRSAWLMAATSIAASPPVRMCPPSRP